MLLLPADLFTTMAVTHVYGLSAEANPIMRWLLQQHLVAIIAVHIAVGVAATGVFVLLLEELRGASPPYDSYLERGVEVWLGLLVIAGLVIVGNNLLILWFGRSVV